MKSVKVLVKDADIVDLSHRKSRAPLLLQDVQANLSLGRIQVKFPSDRHSRMLGLWVYLHRGFFLDLPQVLWCDTKKI